MESNQEETPETLEMEPEMLIVDLTEEVLPATVATVSGGDGSKRKTPARPAAKEAPRDAKTGPPSAMEWQDFIGGTVLRLLTEGYLQLVLFKDIDESELTEHERNMIRLDRDDLKDMAAPLASFANKSKIARKHGRVIIAAGDSYESLIDLVIWMRRVGKIAKKYRKPGAPKTVKGKVENNGQVPQQDIGADQHPAGPYIYNPGTG